MLDGKCTARLACTYMQTNLAVQFPQNSSLFCVLQDEGLDSWTLVCVSQTILKKVSASNSEKF